MKVKRRLSAGILSLSAVLALATLSVRADDYADGRVAAADRAADLGSLYFFLDPNDNNFAIAAVTIGGGISPAMNANLGFFDEDVKFVFAFENTGDAASDVAIEVSHAAQTSRTVPQTATIHVSAGAVSGSFDAATTISRAAFGPQGPPTFGGGTSAQQLSTVTTDATTGISYFGGLIDDPFFYDLGAELAYRSSRFANMVNPAILTRGRDSFAGSNTMAVVLRVPVSLLTAGNPVVGLSVYAQRSDKKNGKKLENVDRVGNPLVNNLFTSFQQKDLYNAADTIADAAGAFSVDIRNTLTALQTDATSINIFLGICVTNGDMLRLNTSIANTGPEGGTNAVAAYPNGRRPNDDVVDTILTLVNNRVFQGDAVNDNELAFRNVFPFFAQPHMPFPPGAGSEDLTRH